MTEMTKSKKAISPFEMLGLTRRIVGLLLPDPKKLMGFLNAQRGQFARFYSPTMTATLITELNNIVDRLEAMSTDELVVAAKAYINDGDDEELFGPKRDNQQLRIKVTELEQRLLAAQKRIELLGEEADKEVRLAYVGMTKIMRAASVTEGLPKGYKSPAMLHDHVFFGNIRWGQEYRNLSPEEAKRTGRKKSKFATSITQTLVRVASGFIFEGSVRVDFPVSVLYREAQLQLQEQVRKVLEDPALADWENKGLFIGFSKITTGESAQSILLLKKRMTIDRLAIAVSANHFQVAADIEKITSWSETNYLVSISAEEGNLFRIHAVPVNSRRYGIPIAPP